MTFTINSRVVSWVGNDATLSLAIARHQACTNYALDTEFSSGATYEPVLALVQLGWSDEVLLIDPFSVDLTLLAPLFASSAEAIVHAGEQDLDLLERAVGIRPSRLFDTQLAASLLGMSTPSLATLVKRLGVTLDKSQRLTDWTVRPLNQSVLHYAASDVAYLHEVYSTLDEGLTDLGRRSWLDEECAVLLSRELTARVAQESWWRIPGALTSSTQHQARYQALAGARDTLARTKNRPPSHIISDDALIALTRAWPARPEVLSRLPSLSSVPPTVLNSMITALKNPPSESELCLSGLEMPSANQDRLVTVLAAYSVQLAHELSIDRALLATKPDLVNFVLGRPSRLDSKWRREVLTDTLDSLLSGEAALGVRSGKLVVAPCSLATTDESSAEN